MSPSRQLVGPLLMTTHNNNTLIKQCPWEGDGLGMVMMRPTVLKGGQGCCHRLRAQPLPTPWRMEIGYGGLGAACRQDAPPPCTMTSMLKTRGISVCTQHGTLSFMAPTPPVRPPSHPAQAPCPPLQPHRPPPCTTAAAEGGGGDRAPHPLLPKELAGASQGAGGQQC